MSEQVDLDAIEARAKRCAVGMRNLSQREVFEDDVPALVAEVRALRAKVSAIEGLADWWDSGPTKHLDTHTNEAAAHRIRDVLNGER